MSEERHPAEIYGTPEHEAYLLELEERDVVAGPENGYDHPGGCGCIVSVVYGGDCAHTIGDFE